MDGLQTMHRRRRQRRFGIASLAVTLCLVAGVAQAASAVTFRQQATAILWQAQRLSGMVFGGLMLTVLLLSWLDRRRARVLRVRPPLSVLIPCYNDRASIAATIESVFASYDAALLDVLVVDDASTDDSAQVIVSLQPHYPFRFVRNPVNRGKSPSLNALVDLARHDLLLFVDADTQLNPVAVADLLARFEEKPRLGAVSCPYRPSNRGALPKMQAIEYNMIVLTQGAYNQTSALALWGGCLAVRRAAFLEVGRFSLNAITEDVDLAFKLNRAGWRVAQSFVSVLSIVPQTLAAWARQKIRWTSGGLQCHLRHMRVWMRNPIQAFFIVTYSVLTATSLSAICANVRLGDALWHAWRTMPEGCSLGVGLAQLVALCGPGLWRRVLFNGAFSLLSIIYVLPLVRRSRDLLNLLLFIPFSFAYFPAYIVISLVGFGVGLHRLQRVAPESLRGW